MSSSYLITSDYGRIVVNTGMWFEARTHKRNYDAVTTAPTRYIILTQSHTDHIGGVDTFRVKDRELHDPTFRDELRRHRKRWRRLLVAGGFPPELPPRIRASCSRTLSTEAQLVSPFAVVERESDIARVALPYPLFVKPVAEPCTIANTTPSDVTMPNRS